MPFLISNAVSAQAIQDLVLALVAFAFFSCGLAIQAAAARLIFSAIGAVYSILSRPARRLPAVSPAPAEAAT
ncbi:MAG TPA: hypothetical protein VG520_08455 [Candidatus Dormibacteraeota bacterium]|nr:hypothetical protein [Candidatus Dormibacteraeota bacterium]